MVTLEVPRLFLTPLPSDPSAEACPQPLRPVVLQRQAVSTRSLPLPAEQAFCFTHRPADKTQKNPNPREAKAEGNTWGGEAGLAGRAAPAPSCERQAQLWLPARAAAELCSALQRRLPAPPSCFKDTYIITSLYRRIFLPSVVKGTGNNSVKITVQLDCSASFEKIKKGGV